MNDATSNICRPAGSLYESPTACKAVVGTAAWETSAFAECIAAAESCTDAIGFSTNCCGWYCNIFGDGQIPQCPELQGNGWNDQPRNPAGVAPFIVLIARRSSPAMASQI